MNAYRGFAPTRRGMRVGAGVVRGWAGAGGKTPAGAQGSSQCELFIHRLQRSGGRCQAEPPAGARHDATAYCRRGPVRACDAGGPLHRPGAADFPPAPDQEGAGIPRVFRLSPGEPVPFTGQIYFNGHEYAKQQCLKQGITFTSLDNAFGSVSDAGAVQRICDGLDDQKIYRFAGKWLARLPQPFTREDEQADYRWHLSVQQIEFSTTMALDRPASARIFFEQLMPE